MQGFSRFFCLHTFWEHIFQEKFFRSCWGNTFHILRHYRVFWKTIVQKCMSGTVFCLKVRHFFIAFGNFQNNHFSEYLISVTSFLCFPYFLTLLRYVFSFFLFFLSGFSFTDTDDSGEGREPSFIPLYYSTRAQTLRHLFGLCM